MASFTMIKQNLLLILPALIFFLPRPAAAQEISPAVIEITEANRTAAVTVSNRARDRKEFIVSLLSSGENKKDTVAGPASPELVFYPKQMTMEAGESRLVRIGYSRPMPPVEEVYLLHIGPASGKNSGRSGAGFAHADEVSIRVLPGVPAARPGFKSIRFEQDVLEITISNDGNARADISGISLKGLWTDGNEALNRELAGFYLPAGQDRTIRHVIPPALLNRIHTLHIDAWSAGRSLRIGCIAVRTGTSFELRGPDCAKKGRT